jgi:hypothetical protein
MTSVRTYEGRVEDGQIRLRGNIALPDETRVYVVVPEMADDQPTGIRSPRLVHPEQAGDFVKEVLEVQNDAVV